MCGPERCRNLDLICQISGSLPPANEVWGKVIFSEACVKNSVRGGAWSGGCLVPGVPGRGGGVPAPGGGACSWGGVPGGDPPDGYCCGRYAFYWNAFLLRVMH